MSNQFVGVSEPLASSIIVLVVEDDPLVRAIAADTLEEEGFEVIEAPSADHAVSVLKIRNDIRVLFTDVTMPGTMNGFDLARLAQQQYPHIAVLVTSGALPPGFNSVAPEARFIPKPYKVREVVSLIRQLVSEKPAIIVTAQETEVSSVPMPEPDKHSPPLSQALSLPAHDSGHSQLGAERPPS
ncbi:response regulator [Microvirga lotononidis]|nr:response regulator [Microvirga lotononidis]